MTEVKIESTKIMVGAGGKLVVPREDLSDFIDDGTEIDFGISIRRPHRRDWIAINPARELQTVLLLYKRKEEQIETEYYYVIPELRERIKDELRPVRIVLYFSTKLRRIFLMDIPITTGNSWYESKASLLKQPQEFFAANLVRVISDKDLARIRVRYKPIETPIDWPETSTEELLGEALGPERFITSEDHPVYEELVSGSNLKGF